MLKLFCPGGFSLEGKGLSEVQKSLISSKKEKISHRLPGPKHVSVQRTCITDLNSSGYADTESVCSARNLILHSVLCTYLTKNKSTRYIKLQMVREGIDPTLWIHRNQTVGFGQRK